MRIVAWERQVPVYRLTSIAVVALLLLSGCGGEDGAARAAAPTATPENVQVSTRLIPHPKGDGGAPSGCYEYLPPGYGDGARRPLLVVLHGFGESGDGSAAQLRNLLAKDSGVPWLIRADRWPADRPFVVLAPQHAAAQDAAYDACGQGAYSGDCTFEVQHDRGNPVAGSSCVPPTEIHAFLEYAIAKYDVDPGRVYLTGLSCGAFGAYEYLAEYGSTQIAALVAIAGDARPALSAVHCQLAAVPIWAFHGDADDVVSTAGSTALTTELSGCPQPRPALEVTVYPGVGHDSWVKTYDLSAGHDIYAWFLGFTKT
jgi:poly(3-hydroxybutyrate) depolymerase